MANKAALSGIKVLENGEFISAPYAGKLLASMGAEVIKVEKPCGDPARDWGPFPGDKPNPEKSGLFLVLNTGKKGITLNLETATGQKIYRRLAQWADVIIESNMPKENSRLGINYKILSQLNPSLIMASITPFGQTGPYRNYKSNCMINIHISGEGFGNPAEGVPDPDKFPPLQPPYQAGDYMTGLSAAVGAMSGIYGRQQHGHGGQVDIAAVEALASVGRQELAFALCERLQPTRQKGRKRRGGILYQCKDGYVCVWAGPHFTKLVAMMGNPDWAQAELFQNAVSRSDHMEEFNQLMTLWTVEHTMAEIDKISIEFGVPCSPVRNVRDVLADEQLAYRNYFVEIEHPAAGKLKYPGAPFKLSGTPWQKPGPAPLLGQHNEEVYCGILDYGKDDLVKMAQAGII